MRLSGTSSFPFFSHTPRTFSSETSHLNTAWSLAPTARSAMLWYTSSFFSGVGGQAEPVSPGGGAGVGVNLCGPWGSVCAHLGKCECVNTRVRVTWVHLLVQWTQGTSRFRGRLLPSPAGPPITLGSGSSVILFYRWKDKAQVAK